MFGFIVNLVVLVIARLAFASMGLIVLSNTDLYKNRTLRKVRLGYNNGAAVVAGTNEVQTATISGGPTGGSFTLTFNGATTAAIAFNAAAADVQSALEALGTIGAGGVSVTGSAGGPYTVTFVGARGATNQPQMTAAHTFTGGTSPSIAVATTTEGAAGVTGIGYLDINPRGVSLTPDAQEMITQGVSSKDKDREVDSYGLAIDQQYAAPALDEIALKGGYGDGIMPSDFFEIELTHTMVNRRTGKKRTEVTRWLKCALTQADPAGGEARQVVNTQVLFEAALTTKDIRGTALPSVPADGAFFGKTATEV